MDQKEIRDILDGLDRRLALGEIDQDTYKSIKVKFSEKTENADPVSSTASNLAKEAYVLKCPGCMAPLPSPQNTSITSVVCVYCGGSFALKIAEDEMDRLKNDIRKWMSDLVGTGGSNSSTIDEASRKFIFNEKLFPSLKMAADRATELFGITKYGSMFTFALMNKLTLSPFMNTLIVPDSPDIFERIKIASARADSPDMLAFAVEESHKTSLTFLQVLCHEIVYLTNARRQLSVFTPEGFEKSKMNYKALAELYEKSAKKASNLSTFYLALRNRILLIISAIEQLEYLHKNNDSIIVNKVIDFLEKTSRDCAALVSEIEQSNIEVREKVLAMEGTRNDAQTILIMAKCMKLFSKCGTETGTSFDSFMKSLESIIENTKEANTDINWLDSFLTQLILHIEALDGESTAAVIADYSWEDTMAATGVRSSFFGGKETYNIKDRILVPFWVVELSFSQQAGFIFKKGSATKGLLFIDASKIDGSWNIMELDHPFSIKAIDAIKTKSSIGQSYLALAPIIINDRAIKRVKQIVNTTKGFGGAQLKLLDIVHLPAATISYSTNKSERTEILFPIEGINFNSSIKIIPLSLKQIYFT